MTFEQACNAGIYGDAECLKKVEDVRCRIKTIRGDRSLKCKPVYAVTGGSIDVGRMLAGDPRCFRSWRRQITTQPGGKIVRLIINNAYSAGTATGDIMRRGAAICALIDAYETAGFRCDVVLVYTNLVYTSKTEISRMEDRIILKRAEQPLDLDAMAFALVHPAAFRRLCFAAMERNPSERRKTHHVEYQSGYGSVGNSELKGDVDVPTAKFTAWNSDGGAVNWLRNRLRERGILEE
jgi:hypothetical protein